MTVAARPPGRVQPVLLAVDRDADAIASIEHELAKRYGEDYRVACARSVADAETALESMARTGAPLAMVLVDNSHDAQRIFARAKALHPRARRALTLAPTDTEAWTSAPAAMRHGLTELLITKPFGERDEQFHQAITDALYEWGRSESSGPVAIRVIGERWSARSQEIRDRLERNGVPYAFHAGDSPEGAELLARLGLPAEHLPVFVFFDGEVLVQPDDAAVADRMARSALLDRRDYDVIVVGGGPAGLAAAVYASSEGLSTLVLEQEAVGGQAGSTSRIRNYLGFPHGIAGNELAVRAARQAWLFGARFHWMRGAVDLDLGADGQALRLSDGDTVRSRVLIVATGVSWRRLDVREVEALVGSGVSYGAAVSEAAAMEGRDVHVVGGGNSAGQAALHLARYAARVTVLVRGTSLATSMSDYLVDELGAAPNIALRFRTTVSGVGGEERLEEVVLEDSATGATTVEPSAGLFVLIGGEPRTQWLPDAVLRDPAGYILTDRDLPAGPGRAGRLPLPLESSVPGVFAAGDVRRGSIKRVASAVGEGAIAVHACHQYLASRPTDP